MHTFLISQKHYILLRFFWPEFVIAPHRPRWLLGEREWQDLNRYVSGFLRRHCSNVTSSHLTRSSSRSQWDSELRVIQNVERLPLNTMVRVLPLTSATTGLDAKQPPAWSVPILHWCFPKGRGCQSSSPSLSSISETSKVHSSNRYIFELFVTNSSNLKALLEPVGIFIPLLGCGEIRQQRSFRSPYSELTDATLPRL